MHNIRSLAFVALVVCVSSVFADDGLQTFLDNHQYSVNGIQRYEQIFGRDFVSTGGLETTRELVGLLGLKAGERVLDVGAGTGGSAFYMARYFGAFVEGVDLSRNMVEQARRRADELRLPVTFSLIDIMAVEYPPASFDVIYSRDTLLHIAEKPELFKKFRSWLKPGGRLMITDYCAGEQPFTEDFQEYIANRQYKLVTVEKYGQLLVQAGFENVVAENRTGRFVDALTREIASFEQNRSAFLTTFSEGDYNAIVDGWQAKLERCAAGLHNWGLFMATNPESVEESGL